MWCILLQGKIRLITFISFLGDRERVCIELNMPVVDWLVGWLVGLLVGWLVGWLVGRSVGQSVGRSVSQSYCFWERTFKKIF